jgi:bifunctional ADP-heptose synthase (sugar kinase/adenylyltransferase)
MSLDFKPLSVNRLLKDNERFCLSKGEIREAIESGKTLILSDFSKTEMFYYQTVINEIRIEKLKKING